LAGSFKGTEYVQTPFTCKVEAIIAKFRKVEIDLNL
jgi:hypothetical protein